MEKGTPYALVALCTPVSGCHCFPLRFDRFLFLCFFTVHTASLQRSSALYPTAVVVNFEPYLTQAQWDQDPWTQVWGTYFSNSWLGFWEIYVLGPRQPYFEGYNWGSKVSPRFLLSEFIAHFQKKNQPSLWRCTTEWHLILHLDFPSNLDGRTLALFRLVFQFFDSIQIIFIKPRFEVSFYKISHFRFRTNKFSTPAGRGHAEDLINKTRYFISRALFGAATEAEAMVGVSGAHRHSLKSSWLHIVWLWRRRRFTMRQTARNTFAKTFYRLQ